MKKVLTFAVLVLVFAFSVFTFTALADDTMADDFTGWKFLGDNWELAYYVDGTRLKGVHEVDLPVAFWPGYEYCETEEDWVWNEAEAEWGPAPATRYFYFDSVTGELVKGDSNVGWKQVDGNWYNIGWMGMLHEGWFWDGAEGTYHYLRPAAVVGSLELVPVYGEFAYDEGRVTHRWFNFSSDKGALIREMESVKLSGEWVGGLFYFGYGVTQGWAYNNGEVFYYGNFSKPVLTVGNATLENPWTTTARSFSFGTSGRIAVTSADLDAHFEYAVEEVFAGAGLTFVIIERLNDNFANSAFNLIANDEAGNVIVTPVKGLHRQDGGWRIALDGEFTANQITLQIVG
jgi:hypothetical protein